jgi:hypothetical protein
MKRTKGYLLIILFPFLVQCGDYVDVSGISYGNMDCSSAVLTTDVFQYDSVAIMEKIRIGDIDDFGMASFGFSNWIPNACAGDSVICEIIFHLGAGAPKEIFVSQEVVNNGNPTEGTALFTSKLVGDVYEITSRGSYMAPSMSSDAEFSVSVLLFFESTGGEYSDFDFIKQYIKDFTIRFTYSKLPLSIPFP